MDNLTSTQVLEQYKTSVIRQLIMTLLLENFWGKKTFQIGNEVKKYKLEIFAPTVKSQLRKTIF